MSNVNDIKNFLKNLDLNAEDARIMEVLFKFKRLTIWEITKITRFSRTNIYRIVSNLQNEGLIIETEYGFKKYLSPAPLSNFDLLIKEKENKINELKKNLPQISVFLDDHNEMNQPGTKIRSYVGISGIKQMMWNSLQAKTEILGFSFKPNSEIVGKKFAELWTKEFIARKLCMRDIINEEYGKKEIINKDGFETKLVSEKIFKITHQIDLYNDITAFYTWHEREIFGIEIENSTVTDLQRNLFENIWNIP